VHHAEVTEQEKHSTYPSKPEARGSDSQTRQYPSVKYPYIHLQFKKPDPSKTRLRQGNRPHGQTVQKLPSREDVAHTQPNGHPGNQVSNPFIINMMKKSPPQL
jgi:hypothetical protein